MEPEQLLHSEHSSAAASLLPSLLWLINSRLVQLKSKIWGRCLWSEKAPRPADCCVQSAASVPGLFLAAPGLRCCGLLIAVAPLVGSGTGSGGVGSAAGARGLGDTGLDVLRHVGSSWTRN